jgi:K+-sensing histidine kinase KdpD
VAAGCAGGSARPGAGDLTALPAYRRPGAPPRARFRPLLVVTACALCLPAVVLAGPGGEPDRPVLVVMVGLVVAAVVGRVAGSRGSSRRREVIGVAIIVAVALALVFASARSSLLGPAWLGMLAAASVSMATIRRTSTRLSAQGLLVVGATVVLATEEPELLTSAGVVAVAGPMALLIAIAGLASALAGDLERARRRELATRRAAERRAELLEAVRQLSAAGRGEVIGVTIEALRTLGFPVAAVLLVEGDRLVPRRVDGVPAHPDFGAGISGHALETGATVVSPDYAGDPLRLPGLSLGAAVATPVRADGRTLGVLTVGLFEAGEIPVGDVEVVEVLAAHLGGALVTERILDNQAALLGRLRDLDVLRRSFVDRVSEDLRDPLTVVRGVAQTLETHGERLPETQRRALLGRMTSQALDLKRTLEAMLDFSRVQVGRVEPRPEPIDLLELLAPALAGTGIDVHVDGRPVVVVDRELVRQAVELLRRASLDVDAGLSVDRRDGVVTVDVHLRDLAALQGGFARTLAEQLLVAAGAASEELPDGLRLLLPHDGLEVPA